MQELVSWGNTPFLFWYCQLIHASVDKGTHACGPDRIVICRVIVLAVRHQYACVRCLADGTPDRPASPRSFFTVDKRRPARQTRKMGCRPSTRITTPDVVLPREKPCVPSSADASILSDRFPYFKLPWGMFLQKNSQFRAAVSACQRRAVCV